MSDRKLSGFLNSPFAKINAFVLLIFLQIKKPSTIADG
jgi:hypothetical protein